MANPVTAKRLDYVKKTWPRSVYETTAWLAIQMVDNSQVQISTSWTLDRWHEWLRGEERAGRIAPPRGVQYLPWFAAQTHKAHRRLKLEHERGPVDRNRTRSFPRIVDWALSERVDLGRFSFAEALKATNDWHRELEEQQKKVLASGDQGFVAYRWPTGWTVQQLTTWSQLKAEGDAMGHCVASYFNAVHAGVKIIYSLRDPKGQPHATVCLRAGVGYYKDGEFCRDEYRVDEAQGIGNSMLAPSHRERLSEWLDSSPVEPDRRGLLGLERLSAALAGKKPSDDDELLDLDAWAADPLTISASVDLNERRRGTLRLWAAVNEELTEEIEKSISPPLIRLFLKDKRLDRWERYVRQTSMYKTSRFIEDYEAAVADVRGVPAYDLRGSILAMISDRLWRHDPQGWQVQSDALGDPVTFEMDLDFPSRPTAMQVDAIGKEGAEQLRQWWLTIKRRIDEVRTDARHAHKAQPVPEWVARGFDAIYASLPEPPR